MPASQLAAALLSLGRNAEAEPELREVLRTAPGDPEALYNLGNLLWADEPEGGGAEAVRALPRGRAAGVRGGPPGRGGAGVARGRLTRGTPLG